MIYILVVAVIFIGDLIFKNYVEATLQDKEKRICLNGKIILEKYHNTGAFLNFGEARKKLVAVVSLVFVTLIAVLFLITLTRKGAVLLKLGLALLLGGGFSNTYDRMKRGYVVDYLRFGVKCKPLRDIVFNVSDFCIMAGAAVAAVRVSFTE